MGNRITEIAQNLRKNPTHAENLLWKYLRRKQFAQLKFRRQQPIDHYIVDFVCIEKKIIIEVDGGQHSIEREKDIERENYLRRNGFKVLRFWNNDILENIEGVLEEIMKYC